MAKRIQDVSPIQLFTSNRLDLVFKLVYAESVARDSKAIYPHKIYKKHLFSVTGSNGKFIEYGNVIDKKGFSQFETTFKSLISGNVLDFPPIHLDHNFALNNGAHRAIAAFVQGKSISAFTDEEPRGIMADYNFFKVANRWRYRLNKTNLDYALLRLASLNPRIQIVVVYPTMRNRKLLTELRNHQSFFLERNFRLNVVAKRAILDFIYPESKNFVNLSQVNLQNAFRDRFNLPGKLRIFFFESRELDFAVGLKTELRDRHNLSNGSIHTPDNHKESIDLLEVLLLKNSRHNIHNIDTTYAKKISVKIDELELLDKNAQVVGSTPLALFGLRDSRDLDLIFPSNTVPATSSEFDSHNAYWEKMKFNVDELLENPKFFMRVYGVKYISIRTLLHFKLRRGEVKDFKDLSLMAVSKIAGFYILIKTISHWVIGYLRLAHNLWRKFAM